jgi:hypothetical protein
MVPLAREKVKREDSARFLPFSCRTASLRLSTVSWRNLSYNCVYMANIDHRSSFLCLGDTVVMSRHCKRDGEPRSRDVPVVIYKNRMT